MKTKTLLIIAVSVLLTVGGSVWAQVAPKETLTMVAFPDKMKAGYKINDFVLLEKPLPAVGFTNDEAILADGLRQGKLPRMGVKYNSKTIQELYARVAEKLGVDLSPIGRGENVNLYTAIREKL